MKKIFQYLKQYKKEIWIGPFLKLTEAMIEILLPTILAMMIDQREQMETKELLLKWASLFVLIMVGFCFACMAQYMAAEASHGYSRQLRKSLVQKIMSLSIKQVESLGGVSLTNRIIYDVVQIEIGIGMWIRLVIRVPFICIGSFIMTFLIEPKIAILLLLVTILLGITIFLIIKFSSSVYQKVKQKLDDLTISVMQNLVNVRVIRAFVTQKEEKRKFHEKNDQTYQLEKKSMILSGLLNPVVTIILNITILIILWTSHSQIHFINVSQGQLIAIVNYISQMLLSMIVLSNLVVIYTKAFSAVKRIEEVLKMVPDQNNGIIQEMNKEKGPMIEFQNVSFSYEKGEPVLDQINLTIGKGEIVGIIGLTGSGKSTLLNLMNRSYDVQSGEIFITEEFIQNYDIKFLKKNIRMIEQKPTFFRETIQENVMLGEKEDHSMIKILEKAQAYEFVSQLPNQELEELENQASRLSGGQKQRISIARAFVGKPYILLLDDIASALDSETEERVLKEIKQYAKENEITVILATQKVSALQIVDRVIEIEEGKIIEEGIKEDVVKRSKLYQKMIQVQKEGELG